MAVPRRVGRAAAARGVASVAPTASRTGARSAAPAALADLSPASILPAGFSGSLVFNDDFNAAPTGANYAFYPCWGDNLDPEEDPDFLQGDTTTTGRGGFGTAGISASGGKLTLAALNQSQRYGGQTFPYTSCSLRTLATYRYGYFETRVKLPAGASQGIWPSFWLMPATYDPNAIDEIDVMECPSTSASLDYLNYHWGTEASPSNDSSSVAIDLTDAYHTLGVWWTAGRLRWYIDGTLVRDTSSGNISSKFLQVVYWNQVGGSWPGAPDGSTVWPSNYLIEFLRIYQ